MILVRTEMQCKWGRVQEVLDGSKASYERMAGQLTAVKRIRILTDLSGSHDTVILEVEIESLDAYFAMMNAIFASPEFKARQAALTNTNDHPYQSAVRTFYTIEAVYE